MKIFFGKEEKTALLLLLIVVVLTGIVYLALENAGKENFASLYSPSSAEGVLVCFDGEIDEIIYTKTGDHIIIISGNDTIFIRNGASSGLIPDPAGIIHAVGIVQNYNGEREIYVSDPSDVDFKLENDEIS